jgi:RHS repeat-associated protein
MVSPGHVVVASYRYDPFGNLVSKSGPLADANVYRFSSKEIHVNSGLYYYGYRFYSPNLQRWINRDPIGEWGGMNLHCFVRNNTVNFIDPDGTTIVVSPTPFPGQEGTHGPYILIIDDGSDSVKNLKCLEPHELFKNELETCRKLQEKSQWDSLNPDDEAGFDTPYFKGLNADSREYYSYHGQIYADNEINYYGIGMYEAWAGDPLIMAELITFLWKVKEYFEIPNENTYFWLRKGYSDYLGFTLPAKPLPGHD